MANEKDIKLNKKHSEDFLSRLDEKPSGRAAIIYQAIIVSLFAHIFILFITHQLTQDTSMVVPQEFVPVELDMLEPEQVEQVQQQEEARQEQIRTGKLRDVTANENSQRTNEVRNYRGMTQDQINEQVYNDLKAMEADEFNKLSEGRPDIVAPPKGKDKDNKPIDKPNEWYKDPNKNNKSYSGNVSASYYLPGRDATYDPKPTYRCKSAGTIVIKIKVDPTGAVIETEVDESKSSANECLRSESQIYAQKWKFDYKSDAVKRQEGTITFTFSAQ